MLRRKAYYARENVASSFSRPVHGCRSDRRWILTLHAPAYGLRWASTSWNYC